MDKVKQAVIAAAPLFVLVSFLIFMFYQMVMKENMFRKRIRKKIVEEIIRGNKVAIAMNKGGRSFRDIEDEPLIIEALNGNKSAISALGIRIEEGEK